MSKAPKVSVIIPTYNRAHVLGRSVRSVLDQSYGDFELVIVDDCSTDNTKETVQRLADERIRYIRLDKNSGTPATPTNRGIEVAQGEYIAVQDSDDEWLPDKLEKQMKAFNDAPAEVGIVYTDAWRVRENGKKEYWPTPRIVPDDGIIYDEALAYRVIGIGTHTLVIKKECFDKVGLFDTELPNLIDTELLIRMSKFYCFYHIAEPLVNYYVTSGSVSSTNESAIVARKLILEKHYRDISRNKKVLATHYFGIGDLYCLDGEIEEGRHYLMKAVAAYQLDVRSLLWALISLSGQRSYKRIREPYARIRGRCARR